LHGLPGINSIAAETTPTTSDAATFYYPNHNTHAELVIAGQQP
jgi:hypothetical protein